MRGEACKVLLVAPLPPPMGGIARWTEQVLRALRTDPRVKIVHLDISPRWRSIHATGLATRLVGGVLQGIRDGFVACWLLLRHRPAVVHLCTTGGLALLRDMAVFGLARVAGARVAYHVRMGRVATAFAGDTLEGRVLKLTSRLADVVLLLDSATESAVRTNCRTRAVERIPNFIDLEQAAPLLSDGGCGAGERPRILYVGWLVPSKGLRELVGAFARLPPGSATLTLVGPAEEEFARELTCLAGTTGGADAVTMTGELSHDEVLRVMAGCHILVLPSYSEGFPNVLLEAMALGRPIVATKVGAAPEMLGDGGHTPCGLIVPPRDESSLADALSALVGDASLRDRLGKAGRIRVRDRYSAQAVIPRYVDLWSRLATTDPGRELD